MSFFVCIGQYSDDNRTTRNIQYQQQQQQSGIESDEEDDRSPMFQANYQYTPLKDYAAITRSRSTSDNNSNNYQSKCSRKFLFPLYNLKIKRRSIVNR